MNKGSPVSLQFTCVEVILEKQLLIAPNLTWQSDFSVMNNLYFLFLNVHMEEDSEHMTGIIYPFNTVLK